MYTVYTHWARMQRWVHSSNHPSLCIGVSRPLQSAGHWGLWVLGSPPYHSLTHLPITYPPPVRGVITLDTKWFSMDAVTRNDQTAEWTHLCLKYTEKKASCDNTASLQCPWKMFSVSSRHREGPSLVSQAGTEMGSGIIIITTMNINAWIPLLSTHLDDLLMGSLQVWRVKGFQNKIASSNLAFLDEMPLASSYDQLSWSWKQAAIPF